MTAYVVTWRYDDRSGSGAVSVHWTLPAAEAMLAILQKHGYAEKTYQVEAVPCEPLP